MHLDLTNRTAIVTGGGRGIGRTIARTLAGEGVVVTVLDRRHDLLAEVRDEWTANDWPGLQLDCDIRNPEAVAEAVDAIEATLGRIDILVNNAGVADGARVEAMSEAIWDANLDANLKGTFLMCRTVAPIMKRQRSGRILNAASFAAIIPSIGSAAYAASKAGVVAFTRVLASELGPWNVTVNSYAPGMIPTEMNHFAERSPADQEKLLNTLTIRRWGRPEDIANLIVFLCSDQAAYITGALIDTSGGKYATQFPSLAYDEAQ
jgi:3-oxoacyl-[acyl-carrier protein] reductase